MYQALQAPTWVDLVWLMLRKVWAGEKEQACPSSSLPDTCILLSLAPGSWAAVVYRELNPGSFFFLLFSLQKWK